MKPLDQELVWATSGTGEDFQCVDVSYARELIAEIQRLRCALQVIAENPGWLDHHARAAGALKHSG